MYLTAPLAIHDRAVEPVNSVHLLQLRAHGMPSVARTLQSTDDGVLWEFLEVVKGKRKLLIHQPSHLDAMGLRVEVGDRAMVAIVGDVVGSYESVLQLVRYIGRRRIE